MACGRWNEGRADAPTAAILDGRMVQKAPESRPRAGYDEHEGSNPHAVVDTMGHLLTLHVTPASEQERAGVATLTATVQEVSGETPAAAAAAHGVDLVVLKPPETNRGFVLSPRQWVVERSSAWAARFRRLTRDYERLPNSVAGLHFVAFA